MTDKLLMQYTWLGNKTHEKFEGTRVSKFLYAVAKNCPYFPGPRDKNEFRTEMIEVLRTTKQRYRYSRKNLNPTNEGDDNLTKEQMTARLQELEQTVNNFKKDDSDSLNGDYSEDYEGEDAVNEDGDDEDGSNEDGEN